MKRWAEIILAATLLAGCSADIESLQVTDHLSDFPDNLSKKDETMKLTNESKIEDLLDEIPEKTGSGSENKEQRSMPEIEKLNLDLSSISEKIDRQKLNDAMNSILRQAESGGKAIGNPLNIHWGKETGQSESIETEE